MHVSRLLLLILQLVFYMRCVLLHKHAAIRLLPRPFQPPQLKPLHKESISSQSQVNLKSVSN